MLIIVSSIKLKEGAARANGAILVPSFVSFVKLKESAQRVSECFLVLLHAETVTLKDSAAGAIRDFFVPLVLSTVTLIDGAAWASGASLCRCFSAVPVRLLILLEYGALRRVVYRQTH